MTAAVLNGQRILVVEDEYLPSLVMVQIIEDLGGKAVGPVARADQALALAQSEALDGAVLDVSLNGGFSYAVADELLAKGLPIVFATGYDASMLPPRFANTAMLTKPFSIATIERTLTETFSPPLAGGGGERGPPPLT